MFLTKLKTTVGMFVVVAFVGIGVGLLTLPTLRAGKPADAHGQLPPIKVSKKAEPNEGLTKGLTLTLSADKTETYMKPDGSDAVPVTLTLTFTNVSAKPLKLNAYDLRWRIGFRCTGPGPNCVSTLLEFVSRPALPPPAAKVFHLLEPGKSWSPEWRHSFPGDIPQETAKVVSYTLRKPGTYKLRFTYESREEGSWIARCA